MSLHMINGPYLNWYVKNKQGFSLRLQHYYIPEEPNQISQLKHVT